jgi:Asp-tRNA(Asn)/Glu-tRNA(Gln) amidotransferase A subunit family amidase
MEAVGSYEGLVELAADLRSGNLGLTEYIGQLEARFEQREPKIHAFVDEAARFDRLRRDARSLMDRFPESDERPALFGVPIGIKDIIRVDGLPTGAGVSIESASLQGPQADCVTRLRTSGALVIGKTVTTAFAYFDPGPTRNPHNPDHTPGGSSSGSAAAVAAGLCPLALGTQTIGSVLRPAAYCGVVGFKPSYGRVSRAGVIPLAPSVDHVGWLTTDVASAALAASVLCRQWRPAAAGEGPVLAVPNGPYLEEAGPIAQEHLAAVVGSIRAAGLEVRELEALADFDEIRSMHDAIVAAEASRAHARWFDEFADTYDPTLLCLLERGRSISDDELARALDSRLLLRARMRRLMDKHGVDLWLAPSTTGPAPYGLESTGDPVMNLPWTHCGLPALSLPAGLGPRGLPLGVQLVGRWFEDERLLAQAESVESALAALQGARIDQPRRRQGHQELHINNIQENAKR